MALASIVAVGARVGDEKRHANVRRPSAKPAIPRPFPVTWVALHPLCDARLSRIARPEPDVPAGRSHALRRPCWAAPHLVGSGLNRGRNPRAGAGQGSWAARQLPRAPPHRQPLPREAVGQPLFPGAAAVEHGRSPRPGPPRAHRRGCPRTVSGPRRRAAGCRPRACPGRHPRALRRQSPGLMIQPISKPVRTLTTLTPTSATAYPPSSTNRVGRSSLEIIRP